MRRDRHDDRQGPREGSGRPLRGGGRRAPDPRDRRTRCPLDRAPEDAAEPRRQAQPAERRPRDRRRDRQRAADARGLPQLPPVRRRRRPPRAGRVARRPRPLLGRERRGAHVQDRRGDHRPRGRDRRVDPLGERARLLLRGHHPRHRGRGRVDHRRPLELRHPRDRGHRHLQAGRRPVRRGRRPPPRGARGPRLGRPRERAPLRGRAARGESGQDVARDLQRAPRLQPPARPRRVAGRGARASGRARRPAARQASVLRLAPGPRRREPRCSRALRLRLARHGGPRWHHRARRARPRDPRRRRAVPARGCKVPHERSARSWREG